MRWFASAPAPAVVWFHYGYDDLATLREVCGFLDSHPAFGLWIGFWIDMNWIRFWIRFWIRLDCRHTIKKGFSCHIPHPASHIPPLLLECRCFVVLSPRQAAVCSPRRRKKPREVLEPWQRPSERPLSRT